MKKRIASVLLMLVSLMILGGTMNVFAEEKSQTEVEAKYADRGYLILTPGSLRYGTLEPGSSYTETVEAHNIGGAPISFTLSVEPYWIANESYESTYSEPTNHTKLTDWVSLPDGEEYTLESQEVVKIRVRVKVPEDAVGGGQYAAVMANVIPPESNTEAGIDAKARIALRLYSTVNGDIIYKGNVINQSIAGFSFEPIIKSSSTLENTGNTDFEATYKLTIKPLWSDEIATGEPLSETKIILPETKRIFEQNWEEAPALGIFQVAQEITYVNSDGLEATTTLERIVVICPLWLILIIIVALVLIIVAIIIARKKRQKSQPKHPKRPTWEQD